MTYKQAEVHDYITNRTELLNHARGSDRVINGAIVIGT